MSARQDGHVLEVEDEDGDTLTFERMGDDGVDVISAGGECVRMSPEDVAVLRVFLDGED